MCGDVSTGLDLQDHTLQLENKSSYMIHSHIPFGSFMIYKTARCGRNLNDSPVKWDRTSLENDNTIADYEEWSNKQGDSGVTAPI